MRKSMRKKRIGAFGMSVCMLVSMLTGAVPSVTLVQAAEQAPSLNRATSENTIEFGGHSYRVFEENTTWDAAKAICEEAGGHLVTITSEEEQQFITSLLNNPQYKGYWIGGRKSDSGWKWITGEEFQYTNWASNEPNGTGECMQIYSESNDYSVYYWDDTWTDGDHGNGIKNHGYICEWDDAGINEGITLSVNQGICRMIKLKTEAKALTWTSSNPSVATVKAIGTEENPKYWDDEKKQLRGFSGDIMARKEGSARITASDDNGNQWVIKVVVTGNEMDETNPMIQKLNLSSLLKNISAKGGKMGSPTVNLFGSEYSFLDMSIGVELPTGESIQAKYDEESQKIEVLIGFKKFDQSATISADGNKTAYWSESYKQVKSLYQNVTGKKVTTTKLWNDFSKIRGKLKKENNASLGFKVNAKVAGYLEFSCASGTPVFSEGGILTELSSGAEWSFHWAPPFSAVYTSVGVGVDAKGNIGLKYDKKEFEFIGDFSLTGKLTGAIGVGTKKGGTYAEGAVTGKLTTKLTLPVLPLKDHLTVTGGLSCAINIVVLNFDLTKDNLTYKFPDYQFYPSSSKKAKGNLASIQEEDLSRVSREYLENRSQKKASRSPGTEEFLEEMAYPYSAPQLLSLENGRKLLIWNDDDGTKDDANNVSIFYKVYDGESWGPKEKIADDGCLFGAVDAAVNGNNVKVVFTKSREHLAENMDLSDTMKEMELYMAEFDGETFGTVTELEMDTDELCEMNYQVEQVDGDFSVFWVENDENDYLLSAGTNRIYMEQAGDVTLLHETTGAIVEMTSAVVDGTAALIWKEKDQAGNRVYLYRNEEIREISIDAGNIGNVRILDGKLFYTRENQFCSWDLETGTEKVEAELAMDGFEIVKTSEGCQAVFKQTEENGTQTLSRIAYDQAEDIWGFPVQLTDGSKYVRDFSILCNADDTIEAALNLCTAANGEINFSDASLMVKNLTDYADLICGGTLSYDSDMLLPGDTLPLTFQVMNNSLQQVNTFEVKLYDESGSLMESMTVEESLQPGEEKEIDVNYILPQTLKKQKITLQVEAPYKETDSTNNSCSTVIGYADAVVAQTEVNQETGMLSVTIANYGYEEILNPTVAVYLDSKTEEPILFQAEDHIAVGDMRECEYQISNGKLSKDGGTAALIVEIQTASEEDNLANNTAYVSYTWAKQDTSDMPDTPVIQQPGKSETPVHDNTLKKGSFFKVGNLRYQVLSSKKVAVRSMIDRSRKSLNIPGTVKYKGVTYQVAEIANKAARNCGSLKKVTIPSSIGRIGKQAFLGCRKLKSIVIKTTKLTGKRIGKQAFSRIPAKAVVKVPKSKWKSYQKVLKARGLSASAKVKK